MAAHPESTESAASTALNNAKSRASKYRGVNSLEPQLSHAAADMCEGDCRGPRPSTSFVDITLYFPVFRADGRAGERLYPPYSHRSGA